MYGEKRRCIGLGVLGENVSLVRWFSDVFDENTESLRPALMLYLEVYQYLFRVSAALILTNALNGRAIK